MDRRNFLRRALGTLCVPSVAVAQALLPRRIGWIELSLSAEKYGMFEREMAGIGLLNGKGFTLAYRSCDGRIERLPCLQGVPDQARAASASAFCARAAETWLLNSVSC